MLEFDDFYRETCAECGKSFDVEEMTNGPEGKTCYKCMDAMFVPTLQQLVNDGYYERENK